MSRYLTRGNTMTRLAAPKTEFHTLHLRSRILGEVIKEINLNELRVTRLVISADKTIESKHEYLPIPELEQYYKGKGIIQSRKRKWKEISKLPLLIREQNQDRIRSATMASESGIDLDAVNKVLTNPPYDFPYVRVEEFEAIVLKAEEPEEPEKPIVEEKPEKAKAKKEKKKVPPAKKPVPIPKTIKFKRTKVKQANIVSTLKPSAHPGPKYTLELVTTRKKEAVERIREIIAEHDPIKFCELIMKSDMVAVCKEVLEPKE